MISLRKFSATVEINPTDAYNLELVLGECPHDDRHRLLKGKADLLRNNGYASEEAEEMLRGWLNRDEKYSREISDTIRRSWAEWNYLVIDGGKSAPKAIKPDCERVVGLYKKYGGILELNTYMLNRMRMDMTTKEWLSRMYQPTDMLCVGRHMEEIKILSCKEILGQFRHPNPDPRWQELEQLRMAMYRPHLFCVVTPATYRMEWFYDEVEGRHYGRCDKNVLKRRYWCIEMDISEKEKKGHWTSVLPRRDYDGLDLQAGVIFQLFEWGFPIVSIVHSGGKSFHVWCSGAGLTNDEIVELITLALPLGACASSKGLSQFMRLPNPDHPTRPQHCYYFDPKFINHG
jgi:hypothetical protein